KVRKVAARCTSDCTPWVRQQNCGQSCPRCVLALPAAFEFLGGMVPRNSPSPSVRRLKQGVRKLRKLRKPPIGPAPAVHPMTGTAEIDFWVEWCQKIRGPGAATT